MSFAIKKFAPEALIQRIADLEKENEALQKTADPLANMIQKNLGHFRDPLLRIENIGFAVSQIDQNKGALEQDYQKLEGFVGKVACDGLKSGFPVKRAEPLPPVRVKRVFQEEKKP